jgi:NAD(P)H-dependent flavin oxidoreductase YrpB (nitropropane dioxygenase family)
VWDQYFVEGGKAIQKAFKPISLFSTESAQSLLELTVLANFTEVFLAKEGHQGLVGINLLEKIQIPTLPSLFGAMLAGVDYVLMGAGIPRSIPGVLDELALGKTVKLKLDVDGAAGEDYTCQFDPVAFCGGPSAVPALLRPKFLAIISSATLAINLARKSSGRVDGFVVEGATAGGHNAPPRGTMQLNDKGEPVYGERDLPDLEKIKALGLPFWLAGSFGQPGKLAEALALGAVGVQVGTAFAFCEESGVAAEFKRTAIQNSRAGTLAVHTDPLASPTGFPFKVMQAEGSVSERKVYLQRERVCDLGYLRHPYRRPDGTLGYRCPSEPISEYVRKGGSVANTEGRKCVCNGLLATIGLGQLRDGEVEAPLFTAGDDVNRIAQFVRPGSDSYTAADVIQALLN